MNQLGIFGWSDMNHGYLLCSLPPVQDWPLEVQGYVATLDDAQQHPELALGRKLALLPEGKETNLLTLQSQKTPSPPCRKQRSTHTQ